MDISFLLWLQGLRESLPPVATELMVAVSAIAASSALIIIPCVLYWCLDKRCGQFLVFSFSLGTFLNQLIKNTVCCYRPWVRSGDIRPAEGALAEATGYSFPSGHTSSATSLIGGLGWYYRRRRALLPLSILFVVLVGFSRNFLGVHTPQDVATGLAVGILSICAATWLLRWVDEREGRDLTVLVCATLATAAYIAYVFLKPYPTDYDAAGALLVDPVEMQVDCFKSAGVFFGAVLGWFLERRLVGFDTDHTRLLRRHVLRFVVGMAVVAVLHLAPRALLLSGIDTRFYELIKNFLTILGAAYVAPAAFTAVERWVDGK